METNTTRMELTKEEYVRMEIIRLFAGKIQWPPNEGAKRDIENMVNLVLHPEKAFVS
jgi:hypothetical protein